MALRSYESRGVPFHQALQFLQGEPVLNSRDRLRLAQLLAEALSVEASAATARVGISYAETVGVAQEVTVGVLMPKAMRKLGVSALSAQQFLAGLSVTNGAERQVFAVWLTVGYICTFGRVWEWQL